MKRALLVGGLGLVVGIVGVALAVAIFYPADLSEYYGAGAGSGGGGTFYTCDLNDGLSGVTSCYGGWSMNDDSAGWNVSCVHGEGCTVEMYCPGGGATIEDSGDYRCQADRTGIACKDSLSGWWNDTSCP